MGYFNNPNKMLKIVVLERLTTGKNEKEGSSHALVIKSHRVEAVSLSPFML